MPVRPAAAVLLAVGVALTAASCTAGADDSSATTGSTSTAVPSGGTAAVAAPAPTETLLPSPTSTGSRVGALAPGFPADLVSPPEGSEILVSTAEPDAATGLTLISLNLRSPLSTDDLVRSVRDQLVAAGFAETVLDPGAAGLAASSTFVRGDGGTELLTLGVLDRDGVRTLTLGGSVRL